MYESKNSKDYKLSQIDLNTPKNSHDFQILLTGKNKEVLEIGTATGYITKILKENGCKITGIEENPNFATSAKEFTEKMIVGDVETLDLDYHLKDKKFDVILLGDVIEHLKSPEIFLKTLHSLLNENGYLVCSIPNISYIIIRLQLLNGNFDYSNTGLLDDDHLQYFTLKTIISLLDKTNFRFKILHKVKEEFHLPHRSDFDQSNFSEILIDCIKKDPESLTYQYVFSALPSFNHKKSVIVTNDKENLPSRYLKNIFDEEYGIITGYNRALDEIKRKKDFLIYLENAIKEKNTVIHTLENAIKEKNIYLENAIKEKNIYLENAIKEKNKYMENAIKEKNKYIEKIIHDKDAQLEEITSSFLMRLLRKYDKFSGKIKTK